MDLPQPMSSAAPLIDSGLQLENERESFISTAETLVPDSIKQLIQDVQRYAPPVAIASDIVQVTVEGTYYADPSRNPN